MTNRLDFKKGKVGVNSLGGYEKISALVGYFGTTTGPAGGLELDKPLILSNSAELESYGITPEAVPLLCHHITEYFRLGGKGAKLHLLSLTNPGTVTYQALINSDVVKQMIIDAEGEIFNLGFTYVPAGSPTYVDGLTSEMLPAIKAAQTLADWTRETNRPLHVALECAMFKGPGASALNLRDIRDGGTLVKCPQVSVMIGQDYAFADSLTGNEKKHAAIGSLLGCMVVQPVAYNVGEVETMSLTSATRNLWITAGLSSHETVKSVESSLSTLDAKGYIFGEYYSGEVVLSDDHVCTPVIVDADGNMNEHSIALSRTNAKVFREIYKVYLPKVKSTVPVDSQTGKLQIGMIKYLEGFGDRVFSNMAAKQEISGGETTVDPESNLLYGDKALKVFYNWVPMGVISRIEGTINIKKSI